MKGEAVHCMSMVIGSAGYDRLFIVLCRTFAHVTLKERMPRILTQAIDTIHREQERVYTQHGEVGV